MLRTVDICCACLRERERARESQRRSSKAWRMMRSCGASVRSERGQAEPRANETALPYPREPRRTWRAVAEALTAI